jgi:hypothetical protein
MAKNTSNNIKIHFRAEGEQELTNAIKVLSAATTQLKNSQMQLARSMGLTEKERKKSIASGQLALRNQRNMNQAVSQGSMTFSVFRSKLLLASFAIGLVGNSVGRLVAAFAEQEDSEKRIEAALESTGNIAGVTASQIRAMTARLEDVGVVGDEVNNKVASLLLTFTNIRGEAFERTMIAANNMAISISGGIPTFEQLKSSALQLGKALQDPAGQLGALSRSGFTFSGTQKEMIKNLVEQNKLFEAQSIILDAANTQFGGLNEKMQDTATGAFAALGNASGSLAETIGKILTPSTTEFVKSLTELLKSLSKNEAGIRATIDTIKVVVGAYGVYRAAAFAATVSTKQLTTAFITFRTVVNPATAVLSFLGVTYFQLKKRQHELRLSTEDTTESIINQTKAIGGDTDSYEKMKKSLEERVIATRNSAEIEAVNAKIRRQTSTEMKLQILEEKKAVLVKQELNKVDEKYREVAREAVKEIVEGIIAKERDAIITKSQADALKKLNEEQAKRQVIVNSTDEALRLYGVTEAKVARFSTISTKKQFDEESRRIEQLERFDGQLRAMGISSFQLAEAIESGQTISQLSFTSTDKTVLKALASVGLLVNEEGKLVDVTKKFGEVSVSAFEQFAERADIAVQALSGFSQAQTQLVEERMQREMEALKASRDYESATQEEREVMENRIEQRFKSQRKRAFQIQKASNIAEATMNVAQAYTKALATMPPPGNIPLASFVAALGVAQVAAIAAQPAPRFATGGSFITSGPTNMLVGESGAERVTVQPLGGKSARQTSGRVQNININVSAPLVDETILDVIIPKIEEAGKLNIA